VYINGHTIPLCKDLGIIFNNTLSWWEHYEAIISKAYKSLGQLRRVFKDSHSPQARKCLYILLVWSNLLYCSPLWQPYLLKDIILLERVQRRATKFILSDYTSDHKTIDQTWYSTTSMYFFLFLVVITCIHSLLFKYYSKLFIVSK